MIWNFILIKNWIFNRERKLDKRLNNNNKIISLLKEIL